jgi:hypothetical protein
MESPATAAHVGCFVVVVVVVCVCVYSLSIRTIPILYCRGIASTPPHGEFSPILSHGK